MAKSNNDYNMLCRLLLIYQMLLFQLDHLKESENVLNKSKEYNELVKIKEDQRINSIHILLAQADLMTDNRKGRNAMNSILSLKKKAYSESLKISNSNKFKNITIIYALESLTLSMVASGNLIEAKKNIFKTDKILISYPNKYLLINNLIIKGIIESSAKNYKESTIYFSEAISKAENNIYVLYEVYPMISASYGELKDFENASLYSWKYKHIADSLGQLKKGSGDISLINKINLKIFDNKESKQSLNSINIGIVLII